MTFLTDVRALRMSFPVAVSVVAAVFALYAGFFVPFLTLAHAHGITTETVISGDGDGVGYRELGRALLDTGSFSVPSEPSLGYFRTPGYPFFYAAVLTVFRNDLAIPFVQFLLVGISALFVFVLGKRFASPKIGAVAALLYVFDPLTLFQSFETMTETLFVCLFLGSVVLLTQENGNAKSRALATGLLIGVCILVRPLALYLAPLFLLWLVIEHWKQWSTLLYTTLGFILGVAFVCVPWMSRNYAQAGHFAISSAGPYDMLLYNIPEYEHHANGTLPDDTRAQIFQTLGVFGLENPREPLMQFSYMNAEQSLVAHYLAQAPVGYSVYHLVSTLPFFFGSDIYSVQRMTFIREIIGDQPNVNHTYLLYHGQFKEFFKTITADIPQLLERLLWALLLAGSFFAVIYSLITRSRHALLGLLFLALVGAQAVLAGPQSQPRYRMPAAPFIFILGVSGIGIAASLLKKKFASAERV